MSAVLQVIEADPRTKPARYLQITCTNCHTVNPVDRALAVVCPLCSSGPGQPCVDMRSKARGREPKMLTKVHTERVAALKT